MSVLATQRERRCLLPTASPIEITIVCFIQGPYTYDATQHTEAGYRKGSAPKTPANRTQMHRYLGVNIPNVKHISVLGVNTSFPHNTPPLRRLAQQKITRGGTYYWKREGKNHNYPYHSLSNDIYIPQNGWIYVISSRAILKRPGPPKTAGVQKQKSSRILGGAGRATKKKGKRTNKSAEIIDRNGRKNRLYPLPLIRYTRRISKKFKINTTTTHALKLQNRPNKKTSPTHLPSSLLEGEGHDGGGTLYGR